MRRLITKRIGEILLERGVITPMQLEQALTRQKEQQGLLGHHLVGLGYVTEEEIALALTAQYGFPYLPLQHYEIDERVTLLIPEAMARQHGVVPIDRIGQALTVAMADPSNALVIEELEQVTQCTVQAFVSTPSDIRHAIDRAYRRAGQRPPEAPPATHPPRPATPHHNAEH